MGRVRNLHSKCFAADASELAVEVFYIVWSRWQSQSMDLVGEYEWVWIDTCCIDKRSSEELVGVGVTAPLLLSLRAFSASSSSFLNRSLHPLSLGFTRLFLSFLFLLSKSVLDRRVQALGDG